jgi:signal peptidase II
MEFKKKASIFFLVSIIGISLDQWVKLLAIEHLKPIGMKSVLGGFFKFIYSVNRGAWGSLASDWPEPLRSIVLIAIPCVVLLGIGIFIFYKKNMPTIEVWTFSLIFSGGVGNMIDRVFRDGVVDMFWFGLEQYRYLQTNIFNIADVIIMVAAGLLIYKMIQDYRFKQK